MDASTRRATAGVIAGIGLVLLAVGLFLGFGGISKGGVSCGSAFKPNSHDARVQDLTDAMSADAGGYGLDTVGATGDACRDATSNRKPIAWALTAPGGVLLFVGGIMLASDAQSRRESAASAA